VDFLLSRPARSGPAQADDGSAARRLVGRKEDWLVAATDRDFQRLPRALPRGAAHAFGLFVSIGLALFELEKPEKGLLRCDSWIFGPEAEYKRRRDVNNVVLPCGYTMNPDGDTINIYCGAAHCSVALARTSLRSLLDWPDAKGSCERPEIPGPPGVWTRVRVCLG